MICYTKGMKLLKYFFAKQQLRDRVFWIRLLLAMIMVLLLVGQLFTYETFYDVLIVSQSNTGSVLVTTLMILLPIYELIALLALLSMNLSREVVCTSAYVARAVSLLLVAMALNALIIAPGDSTGLLGDTIDVPAHILTLLAMAGYAGAIWFATSKQVESPKKK